MESYDAAERLKWMTTDAVVTLEPRRTRLLKGLYLSSICFGALYNEEVAGSADAMKVVVRDRDTGKVVYGAGPHVSADADRVAFELHRVIRLFGLQSFLGQTRTD